MKLIPPIKGYPGIYYEQPFIDEHYGVGFKRWEKKIGSNGRLRYFFDTIYYVNPHVKLVNRLKK